MRDKRDKRILRANDESVEYLVRTAKEKHQLDDEDKFRDLFRKSLEKDEDELLGEILQTLKKIIEQPLSDKKHWKKRVVGFTDTYVAIGKFHGWLSNTLFARGASSLCMDLCTSSAKVRHLVGFVK